MKPDPSLPRPGVGFSRGEATYGVDTTRSLVLEALDAAGSPLDHLVEPGQRVFVKPNMIAPGRANHPDEWEQIITHPAVIEVMLEEVAERLRYGKIQIGDAPQTDSNFQAIVGRLGLEQMLARLGERHPDITWESMDLRREYWVQRDGVTVDRVSLPGDPQGATLVDLGGTSAFEEHVGNHQYYGADYDWADTRAHHRPGTHEYLVSKSVLDADLFINVPKMKTHKKTGVTLSLKNLVGINADKNYLPHYSLGAPAEGGDEFPEGGLRRRVEAMASRSFKRIITKTGGVAPIWGPLVRRAGVATFGPSSGVVRNGNWWGNDTIWRMCVDLNRILLWYDGDGRRRTSPKPYLSIVDGIVAAEGDGPVSCDAVPLGMIVAGNDPVAVDLVTTRVMGFDVSKVPLMRGAIRAEAELTSLADPGDLVAVGTPIGSRTFENLETVYRFRPHFGWDGHIELEEPKPVSV
jgi:uncharacterized protein (DUF362 family)